MFLEAILIGCLTGFIAAFFGIGGSSVDTPVIRLVLGLSPLLALATPLPLAVVTAAIAFLAYGRLHLVRRRLVAITVAGALPGIVAGSFLTALLSGRFLMLLTAVVLFLIGIDFVVRDIIEKRFAILPEREMPAALLLLTGLAIGLLSGVLANGGGIFFVPAFVIFLRLGIREAIASSLMVVGIIAIPGSIVHVPRAHRLGDRGRDGHRQGPHGIPGRPPGHSHPVPDAHAAVRAVPEHFRGIFLHKSGHVRVREGRGEGLRPAATCFSARNPLEFRTWHCLSGRDRKSRRLWRRRAATAAAAAGDQHEPDYSQA